MLLACVAYILCTLTTHRTHTESNLQSFTGDKASVLTERKSSLPYASSFLNTHSHSALSANFSYFNFWVSPAVSRLIYFCSCICSTAFPGAYATAFTHSRSATYHLMSTHTNTLFCFSKRVTGGGCSMNELFTLPV